MWTTLSILIYLADVVEKVAHMLMGLGSILTFLTLVALGVVYSDEDFKGRIKLKLGLCATILCSLFAIGLGSLLPSSKAVYMIAGVKATEYIANTETAKFIGEEGVNIVKDIGTIIHSYAEDAMTELKK